MTRPRTLYAEDEPSNRKLLEVKFKKLGLDLDLAADGEQALAMCMEHDYDLIILDQYMPGLKGVEVAKMIKNRKPHIPILAITSDDGQVDKLLDAGFSEVLIKPLVGGKYMKIILKYLET